MTLKLISTAWNRGAKSITSFNYNATVSRRNILCTQQSKTLQSSSPKSQIMQPFSRPQYTSWPPVDLSVSWAANSNGKKYR